ncbi:MAG: glucoamylase [Thermoplasmatales archaeon B_DKE]|nr:MAG: glucoamylase [Thermoplasmatales archaeon B_DKE]
MALGETINIDDIEINGYSKIKNHGMIASNRTAALVSMNGTIDWACLPNFNSPAVFDSILDKDKGGFFSVRPSDIKGLAVRQSYEEYTNILITEFLKNRQTVLRVTDFIPASEYTTINFPEIHRSLEAPYADIDVDVNFKPNFGYSSLVPRMFRNRNGVIFRGNGYSIGLATDAALQGTGPHVSSTIKMERGDSRWMIVLYGIKHLDRVSDYKSYARLEDTENYWKTWSNLSNYHGIFRGSVNRSALTLKSLFFEPTGLMVAAPTASLPECIGGERNWDYRYAWIRDTAYVVESLSMIGYKKEATKFLYDIMNMIQREGRVRTIYSINNDENIDEVELDYDGFMSSRPVRIGNKASSQLQVDQYGSIINAIYYLGKIGGLINSYLWDFVIDILDNLAVTWKMPDSSIWEFRTEPKHYVYSKLMSWTAFHRARELGKMLELSAPYSQWEKTENTIKKEIITLGFSKEKNSFMQYYGSNDTDAALLRMLLLGFLPPHDKKMIGTVSLIEKTLMGNNFLFRRYLEDDGLKGRDNAFLLLSFWYVEVLIAMNRTRQAKEVFETIMAMGNHLGLFSEEVDFDTKELLGNFPQAITHLGIIRAAVKLNDKLKNNGKSSLNY